MAGTQLNAANTDSHRFDEQVSDVSAPAAGFWSEYFKSLGLYARNASSIFFVGGARREVYFFAKDMYPSNTAGCAPLASTESATNKQLIQSLDFDQTTQEHAQFSYIMPATWITGGAITYQVYWTTAGGSGGDTVEWNLQARTYTDDINFDQAWGTAVEVSDAVVTSGNLHISAESGTLTPASTLSGGRFLQFRVYRDVADTLAADAKLIAIRLFYF